MNKNQVTLKKFGEVGSIQGRFIRFGTPFTYCLYFVDGLLIDTGPPRHRKEITRLTDSLDIKMIGLTHFHEDHSGNAAWLSRRYQVPVYMGRKTAQILQHPPLIPFYRRYVWGQMESVQGEVLPNELVTSNHRFLVIPSPGHAKDHCCFVEMERGWLFAGDLFLGKRLYYGLRDESVPDMIQSIDSVLCHSSVQTLFCGHAGIVEEGREALSAKKAYLEQLVKRTKELAGAGVGEREIAKELLPRHPLLEWISGGEMAPVHLIRSILKENR
ncbi:MBL fold metallo-hydrolase [Laceyella putida]|uniref:MBL fold metallo-hydrolase n=1 Tax=Laceyella putida TaxID=110101 RepID=A0ABW2RH22_9BACL